MDTARAHWPNPWPGGPAGLPDAFLLQAQLAVLRDLHTEAVTAAVRPIDPFAAPDAATASRRSVKAAARAATLVATGTQRLGEVLELVLAGAGEARPPSAAHLQHAEALYREAGGYLHAAAQHLRLHAGRPSDKPPATANDLGAVRRTAARLRSALRPAGAAQPTAAAPADQPRPKASPTR
ncbi:hypothetical protein ACFVUH_08385 [Kitasatospora sp. NPDC058032]|uniref:hypothetical protein n=1 Tax=Kitasatospora sp. NPDC058032 TaxID=3346307 RepID=UPI0036DE2AD0